MLLFNVKRNPFQFLFCSCRERYIQITNETVTDVVLKLFTEKFREVISAKHIYVGKNSYMVFNFTSLFVSKKTHD